MGDPNASIRQHRSSLTFVSEAAVAGGLARKLKVQKPLVAVENTRGGLRKKSLIHNCATPKIEIDAETYAVTADGELLVFEPAEELFCVLTHENRSFSLLTGRIAPFRSAFL